MKNPFYGWKREYGWRFGLTLGKFSMSVSYIDSDKLEPMPVINRSTLAGWWEYEGKWITRPKIPFEV